MPFNTSHTQVPDGPGPSVMRCRAVLCAPRSAVGARFVRTGGTHRPWQIVVTTPA